MEEEADTNVFAGFAEEMEVETELLVVESGNPVKETPPAAKTPVQEEPLAKPARHVVKQGETLYSISRLYAVTVNDISTWNQLGDAPIRIGQELIIAEPLTIPAETAAQPTAAEEPATPANNGIHTVAAGESLYSLSRKYGVTVNELREWNNLPGSALSIGQQLQVTAPASKADTVTEVPAETPAATFNGSSTTHTVVSGESLYQISRKYGVTIKDIMEWNNKPDFNVKPGEKLLIKKR